MSALRRYLCYDLETCFIKKGCSRSQTKILEVAFKSKDKVYQCLVNPLTRYSNAKDVMDELDAMNQNVDSTLNFWTKLLIGKKALPTSSGRKSVIEKAEAIATLLKRSDLALEHEDSKGMMQALARNDDDAKKAKEDIRAKDDSFNGLFYSSKEAIEGMLKKAEGVDVWVAHNGKTFDEKVLRGHDHEFDHITFIDSLWLIRHLKPGLASYSQPILYRHLFNKKYFAHHALEDAVALHRIMEHVLDGKCVLESYQQVEEKRRSRKEKKLGKKNKVYPESTLHRLKGIGNKTVEKLYKKDIKTDEELIALVNTISFDAWCKEFNFVHHYKRFYKNHCTAGSNTAIV